jgi:hypothetical protein
MDNSSSVAVATLTKGMTVRARWFQVNNPPSSVAGMQMKLGVTEKLIEGVVTHIRGDHPTAPTRVEIHIKPEGGEEIRVKPEHIVEIVKGVTPVYEAREARPVLNTTKLVMENPLYALVGAMDDQARRRPQGSFIEDMEAQGQRELTGQTSKLPTKGSENPAWAKMGVIYGKPDPSDPVFSGAQLPAGWKLKPTEHSMWNHLLDDQGRVRAKMFYKAAFYDRSAHIHPETRYHVVRENKVKDDYDSDQRYVALDSANGMVLFATEYLEYDKTYSPEWSQKEQALRKQAETWLKENRPDWQDASAYWGWD